MFKVSAKSTVLGINWEVGTKHMNATVEAVVIFKVSQLGIWRVQHLCGHNQNTAGTCLVGGVKRLQSFSTKNAARKVAFREDISKRNHPYIYKGFLI